MAYVGDPDKDSEEVEKGVRLLEKQDEAANSGDLVRVVATEELFRTLPEDVRVVSRKRAKQQFRNKGLGRRGRDDGDRGPDARRAAKQRRADRDQRGRGLGAEEDEGYADPRVDYPLGREYVHGERRQRAQQRSQDRAEQRRQDAMQDEVLAAHRQEVDAELMALQTTGAQGARDTLTAAAQAAVADVTAAKNRARAAERRGQKLRDLEIADPDLGPDVAACAELANALQDRISPLQDLQALDEATPSERFTGTQLIEQARAAVDTATTDLGELEGRFGALEVQYQTTINLATTYPNLQLTEPVVNAATGRPGLHPAQNLARLNTLIAGADIWEWTLTAVPQSRRRVGLPNSLMMPNITIPVQNVDPDIGAGGVLNLQIGPEIIMDWLYPNPAHGKSYQDLVTLVKNVLDRTTRIYKMFPSTLQAAQGTNQEISSPNYGFRLILNQTLDMIITYFSTV